ncbi:helix-turn-helix transcriptional regulator [Clavibacter michiganensis]|uniref:HTH domain protein n=1 Tax=Clavibacter michiganensis TaxID=28447 RepID=A0A251YJ30_9MICO|nr:WYL domain-containing protein [Clavibacter michiganensis]OUE24257.1 HTH domain protein [Clavibacter michiganensis]
MRDTSERLLLLLGLLQRRRPWNAEQLAAELDVTDRTIRRDVGRLRALGYPVTSATGTDGGYGLEAGAVLPPLLLDPREAIAIHLALRRAVAEAGPEERADARAALEKVTRVLPERARAAVTAVERHSGEVDLGQPVRASAGSAAPATLAEIARACRSRRQLTCDYERDDGRRGPMRLEPRHLVRTLDRWYLLAYAVDSQGWRTLRVDRMGDVLRTDVSSRPRPDPAEDLDAFVADGIRSTIRRVTGTVRVQAPATEVARWVAPAWGTVTSDGDGSCIVAAGADSHASMARWLLLLDRPLVVVEPPELVAAFSAVAREAGRVDLVAPGSSR